MAASLVGKKLGVLLATAPDHPNFEPAVALMQAGIKEGISVYLYCIDEGVRCVDTPQLSGLRKDGVNLFACAYGAGKRGLPVDDKAAYSGLTVVSDLMASTDRFIAFGSEELLS